MNQKGETYWAEIQSFWEVTLRNGERRFLFRFGEFQISKIAHELYPVFKLDSPRPTRFAGVEEIRLPAGIVRRWVAVGADPEFALVTNARSTATSEIVL